MITAGRVPKSGPAVWSKSDRRVRYWHDASFEMSNEKTKQNNLTEPNVTLISDDLQHFWEFRFGKIYVGYCFFFYSTFTIRLA